MRSVPATDGVEFDKVLRDEADFANEDYRPHADNLEINEGMFRCYAEPEQLWNWREMSALLLGDLSGKELLDFGCGMGEESVYFAKLGARVTAIDISEVGVESARRRAAYHKLPITAHQMRADPTKFEAGSFDRVHGLGILHHIGIEKGLAEVHRVLRPGGVGVFLEPVGDSKVIESVKLWMVKNARFLAEFDPATEHEHNLTWAEIERAVAPFATASLYPYHLLYRLKRLIPTFARTAARKLDLGLLTAAPWLRRYAGAVVIRVVK